MKTHARVVVIGGGIVGCSVLYHLTRMGWSDAVLLERDELTAGSTWHAAGNCPNFSTSWNIMKLQSYSNRLYRRLGGRGRLRHRSPRGRQHPARPHPGAHGRVPSRRRHGERPGPRLRDPVGERNARAPSVPGDPRPAGRPLGSRRRRHRPQPGDPGAGDGCARRRRRNPAAHAGHQCRAHRRGRVAHRHGGRRDHLRDRGQRRRLPGARGRAHGRAGPAGGLDGAPVSGHRGDPRDRGARSSAADRARPGRLLVPAPGTRRAAARALRMGLPPRLGRQGAAARVRQGAVRRRSRPARALHRGRGGARARVRQSGGHARGQRPDPVHAGRQSADRAGVRSHQLLSLLRVQLRHRAGGRRRQGDGRMDRGRRAGVGSVGSRCAPLHRLRHSGVHLRQGTRAVPERVRDRVAVRGAPGRAAGQDDALVRDAAGEGRHVRRARRLGARRLVRA